MRCGVYGKLPAKRDFIAIGTPREFLDVWEPWMQGSIAASRQSLGDGWQEAFLTAPIWRFWLGAELCGTSVAGAFMPSLDGVGRYFPLTVFAVADQESSIPPPEIAAQDGWYAAAEGLLLTALDSEISFEQFSASLEKLAPPADWLPDPAANNVSLLQDGTMALPLDSGVTEDTFAAFRRADYGQIYAAATFWWTVGGTGYDPVALARRRMPDPFTFATMLTGRFPAEVR